MPTDAVASAVTTCGSAETVGRGPIADGSGVPVTTGDLVSRRGP
jgi:hypothetical protein